MTWALAFLAVLALAPLHPAAADDTALAITSISDGAVAPANWFHPLLEWDDDAPPGTQYTVTITAGNERLALAATDRRLVLSGEQFAPFLKYPAVAFVVSRDGATGRVSDAVQVKIDVGRIDDTILYRMVEPLFNPDQDAVIKHFRLDDEQPGGFPAVGSLCVGCHSYHGDAAALNARRGQDRRLIASARKDGEAPFTDVKLGEFSFVSLSPDRKTIAMAAHTRSLIKVKSTIVEPFDMVYTEGDIALFDISSASLELLPGASDPAFVEDSPSWSPDGKTLVFCRYVPSPGAIHLNPVSIFTVPVNNGKGGEAKPLLAEPPSDYCYFPRFSPDGKWISFVSGDASKSYFARQSSDIWLFSIETGTMRRLECNRDDAMDSWHAWSSDSRWLVFSSKRDKSGLTALYLSRIESDGKARPPIKITWDPKWKANLPVLVPAADRFQLGDELSSFLQKAFAR
jgi:hypothetical protein